MKCFLLKISLFAILVGLASGNELNYGDISLPPEVMTTTAHVVGALQFHRADSCYILSQDLRPEGPAFYYPMEINPDAFTGKILHSDMRKYETRKAYYQDVLLEIMLMKDTDLGDFRSALGVVRSISGYFENLAAAEGKELTAARIFQLRTHTPQIASMYSHYPRMSSSLKWFKQAQSIAGPVETTLKLSNDILDIYNIYAINEQSVSSRAHIIRRLVDNSSFKDPALTEALIDAEAEAVEMASGIRNAAIHVLSDQAGTYVLEAGGYLGEIAVFLKTLTPIGVKIPYLAPHGLRTALEQFAKKGALAAFWLVWSAEVLWEDGWQVDQQIQRAVAADTILCCIFERDNIEVACIDATSRVQAYACSAYCRYMSSTIMGDFLDRRSIAGYVRNFWISISNPAAWDILNKRTIVRKTAKEEMLQDCSVLEKWLATAHHPYAGLQISTDPAGAEIIIDGKVQAGIVTPCCLIVDLQSQGPETHTLTVRLPGNKSQMRSVVLKDENIEKCFIPFSTGEGMLDVVFCIDCSGSMNDDLAAVKTNLDALIDGTVQMCAEKGISLQMGLVTYTRHDDAPAFGEKWLRTWPLTADAGQIKANIRATEILGLGAGGGGWEDMYAALLCGMGARDLSADTALQEKYGQPNGKKELVDMGWRPGACKICIPIGDEPPSDPDWRNRSIDRVAERAENLDPVHMYPLIIANPVMSFFFGTRRAMEKLARATGGRCLQVDTANALPQAIRGTIDRAIEDYRYEIWKREHPPNRILGVALWGGAGIIFILAIFLGLRMVRLRSGAKTASVWLQIHGTDARIVELAITKPTVHIGSARDNDLVLPEADAAARQAEIWYGEDGLSLRNLAAGNPIYVNGITTVGQVLRNQDRIRIGGTTILVQVRKRG